MLGTKKFNRWHRNHCLACASTFPLLPLCSPEHSIINGSAIQLGWPGKERRNVQFSCPSRTTGWSNWILLRKLKYFICCLGDLFVVWHLSNNVWNISISGVKFSWTITYRETSNFNRFPTNTRHQAGLGSWSCITQNSSNFLDTRQIL